MVPNESDAEPLVPGSGATLAAAGAVTIGTRHVARERPADFPSGAVDSTGRVPTVHLDVPDCQAARTFASRTAFPGALPVTGNRRPGPGVDCFPYSLQNEEGDADNQEERIRTEETEDELVFLAVAGPKGRKGGRRASPDSDADQGAQGQPQKHNTCAHKRTRSQLPPRKRHHTFDQLQRKDHQQQGPQHQSNVLEGSQEVGQARLNNGLDVPPEGCCSHCARDGEVQEFETRYEMHLACLRLRCGQTVPAGMSPRP